MIWLMRHGQTAFNLQGRYQGRLDSPLTARGRAQAAAVGRLLAQRLDAPPTVLCSPLGRARATAALVAGAFAPPPAITDEPRLSEVALGDWDGLTRAEITALAPGHRRAAPRRQWMFHAPGGERLAPVLARLEAVLDEAGRLPGEVLLVSHAITGRLLRGLHEGLPLAEALQLDAPQNAVFALAPGGRIERVEAAGL
ncbi:histidine phosphatase family protein [Frigidibacter sp. MR17.24]|uniref:histidine phosphatase family protein n=1 Tax=Frigidibacter sp. MR17.24 TaxID=3127345 RepID=UPI003012EA92